jgi:hypothetical protein
LLVVDVSQLLVYLGAEITYLLIHMTILSSDCVGQGLNKSIFFLASVFSNLKLLLKLSILSFQIIVYIDPCLSEIKLCLEGLEFHLRI